MVKFIKEGVEGNDMSLTEILALQDHVDGVFTMIILMYSLAVAVAAITYANKSVVVISTIIIILSITFALFTLFNVNKIVGTVPGYHKLNIWFYFIQCILLFLLYIYMISHFKMKKQKRK